MPSRIVAFIVLMTIFSSVAVAKPPMIAKFSTIAGNFDVLLHGDAAPVSVANFISYADAGRDDSTIIHRSTTYNSSDIQIVQGGGFVISGNNLSVVATNAPIVLEAGLANSRGTLAMARTAERDSATSQWFFNVTDNPGLDGNYAVFGSTIGSGGLSVLDALGVIPSYDASVQLGSAVFSQLPLTQPWLQAAYFVVVHSVAVVPFRVTGVQPRTNGVKIDWTALSTNTPVKVERTTNLVTGSWQIVSSNNIEATFTDTNAPANAAFYRVVTE